MAEAVSLLSAAVTEASYTYKTPMAKSKYNEAVKKAAPLYNDPEVDPNLIFTYNNLINHWSQSANTAVSKPWRNVKMFACGALIALGCVGLCKLIFGKN